MTLFDPSTLDDIHALDPIPTEDFAKVQMALAEINEGGTPPERLIF